MTPVVLDAMELRESGRGVARVLREVVPLITTRSSSLDYSILTTQEGSELLGPVKARVVIVRTVPKSVWEQFGLPWHAQRLGATVVYRHSECAPLWGPPVLLHVPEDPYVRWQGAPAGTWHERARRLYQRATIAKSVLRAPLVVVSCNTIAGALKARYGAGTPRTVVVPLGVDTAHFRPGPGEPKEGTIFHLGSNEPRDQSLVVLQAYALALKAAPDLPDLVIAGNLGPHASSAGQLARALGIATRTSLTGRVTDAELRDAYANAAMCVQPAKYEGFGLQPLEAIACGAPLIVFAEPAVEEVVGGAAEIVRHNTPAGLADAIVDLWRDKARRDDLRKKGPDRALMFPWSLTAERIVRLLESVAMGSRPATPEAATALAQNL